MHQPGAFDGAAIDHDGDRADSHHARVVPASLCVCDAVYAQLRHGIDSCHLDGILPRHAIFVGNRIDAFDVSDG